MIVCVVALLASMGGCSTRETIRTDAAVAAPSGHVSGDIIEASDADQYKPAPGVHFDPPAPSPENALPEYPAEMLSRRLAPVAIKVRLIVDERGSVAETRMLDSLDEDSAFISSVRSAVSHWRFMPLVKIVDGPGKNTITVGDTIMQYDGAATALAFHQDYAFVFEQKDGKPAVRATNGDAAAGH